MSATKRAQLINKLYRVAKKHYQPVTPPATRNVLDHMLYACCLENSQYVAADESFAKLEQRFFDWNEVRVTTSRELAESMKGLYDPDRASGLLKKTLHGVFETYYKFDIDFLKKENLRKTVQQFSKFRGVSPFVVAYTAQVALGGHFIPLDKAMMQLMIVLGIVTESEAEKGKIPGLERTIAKNKGVEFTSVVHQLAAAFHKSPFGKEVREILCSIAPDAKDRFPKRGGRKKVVAAPAAKPKPVETKVAKKDATKKAVAKPAKKATPKKVAKKVVAKATTAKKSKAATKKKTTKKTVKKASRATKKSSTRSLSKKKPR